jgi:hypothetical protein
MIEFTRKRRNRILLLVVVLGLLQGLLVGISGLVGLHPRDIQFFSEDHKAEFVTGKGLKVQGSIEMISQGRDKLIIKEGNNSEEFPFTSAGTYLKDGMDTGTYPILWVRFPPQEEMTWPGRSHFARKVSEIEVTDLTGLIGPGGAVYKLHSEHTTVLWSSYIGSQFSHKVDLLDHKGNVKASGIYDTTCGMMEELTLYKDGAMGTISLKASDYRISRNRNLGLLYSVITGIIILIYHFIFRRRNTEDAKLFLLETDLLILGFLAVFVDQWADIWFYHCTGEIGLVIIHLLVCAFVFWRFGWWAIIPLLELAWSGAFAMVSESLIPQLGYCPAIFITWFALLQFNSFRGRLGKKEIKAKDKKQE